MSRDSEPQRDRWMEEYANCGCSSDAPRRRELLGYCRYHGTQRKHVYPPLPRRVLAMQAAVEYMVKVKHPVKAANVGEALYYSEKTQRKPQAYCRAGWNVLTWLLAEDLVVRFLDPERGFVFRLMPGAERRVYESL